MSQLSPKMIGQANDLMDTLFGHGEHSTTLLRQLKCDDVADEIEREYVRIHDEALACHARLVEAAAQEQTLEFRKNFAMFVAKMHELQGCIGNAINEIKTKTVK